MHIYEIVELINVPTNFCQSFYNGKRNKLNFFSFSNYIINEINIQTTKTFTLFISPDILKFLTKLKVVIEQVLQTH